MKFCYLYLTCDVKEADSLIELLLRKKLIACAKKVPVSASYWWQGEIERTDEVMLVMESAEEMFGEVETELKKAHSYDTFVLTAVPMVSVSKDAKKWLQENLEGSGK